MPSSIYAIETASLYGALDSDAIVDGAPAAAHTLRAMARSAHRLLAKRETVVAEAWDVDGDDGETSSPVGPAWPFWVQVGRWPVRKMRRRELYDVSLGVRIDGDARVDFQLATRRRPFTAAPDPSAPNLWSLTGSGDYVAELREGIEGAPEELDELELYVRGEVSDDLASTGTYGTPNTGSVARVWGASLYASGAAWNTSGSVLSFRHALVFVDGAGAFIDAPRVIVGVGEDTSGKYLLFHPPVDAIAAARLASADFEIRQLPTWRLSHLTVATQERSL